MPTVQTDRVVQLDPSVIMANDNSRYGLKRIRIEQLKISILELGEVTTPVEVEPIPPGTEGANGFEYRLTTGFYRHAAVTELNKTQHAGVALPAIIRPLNDETLRLRRQLSENMDRENQSPMDQAIAIKKLMGNGSTRLEIRKLYSFPGGRKGMQLEMASNSWLNIRLSFLEFPKAIQEKLHDGRLPVTAGMRLLKSPKDKWETILTNAEATRLASIEEADNEEKKLLEKEKEVENLEVAAKKVAAELEAAKVKQEAAEKDKEAKVAAEAEALKASRAKFPNVEERNKAAEHFKALQADAKAAQQEVEAVGKEVVKLDSKAMKAAELAKQRAEALAAARMGQTPKRVVKAEDIDKAAKDAGAGPEHRALKIAEVRAYLVSDVSAPASFPKVKEIGTLMLNWINGVVTDKQFLSGLAVITGEKVEKQKVEKPKGKAAVKTETEKA